MTQFKYRKASMKDLDEIAHLVSQELGTCNVRKSTNRIASLKEITEKNKEELAKDISNYYVCTNDNKIIGACGISHIKNDSLYQLDITPYREILYLVVDNLFQRKGIGSKLMHLCCDKVQEPILYEAWGEKYVNSKFLLEKMDFTLIKDLGNTYYKDNGYCPYCINRDKGCNECKAEVWLRQANN